MKFAIALLFVIIAVATAQHYGKSSRAPISGSQMSGEQIRGSNMSGGQRSSRVIGRQKSDGYMRSAVASSSSHGHRAGRSPQLQYSGMSHGSSSSGGMSRGHSPSGLSSAGRSLGHGSGGLSAGISRSHSSGDLSSTRISRGQSYDGNSARISHGQSSGGNLARSSRAQSAGGKSARISSAQSSGESLSSGVSHSGMSSHGRGRRVGRSPMNYGVPLSTGHLVSGKSSLSRGHTGRDSGTTTISGVRHMTGISGAKSITGRRL